MSKAKKGALHVVFSRRLKLKLQGPEAISCTGPQNYRELDTAFVDPKVYAFLEEEESGHE